MHFIAIYLSGFYKKKLQKCSNPSIISNEIIVYITGVFITKFPSPHESCANRQALREQATGKTTCWDIRWYASAFIKGKLTLYPGQSLVSNIGHDGSGTHCEANNSYDVLLASCPLNVRTPIQPDPEAYFAFADFLRKLYSGNPARKKNWLSKLFKQTKNRIRQTFHKQD